MTSNHVLGNPRTGSAEEGEAKLERLADFVVFEILRRPR
jgi:creatinine amidohydrolase/Fe(II)-dependent formamide hydrolase-like protein